MTSQRVRPPLPSSVSEAARSFLSIVPPAAEDIPLDDTEGWLERVKQTDAQILERFAGVDLPVECEDQEIAGVPTYVLHARGMVVDESTPVYLDLHGGALVFGGGQACRTMAQLGALSSGLVHWAVDYRMPPLYPYPAALDDCFAVYQALIKQRDPQDVFVGGGSAGGNLAAALLLRVQDAGLPMPRALVLKTPELDLTESGDTFAVLDGVDNILTSLMDINRLYADGHDLADPYLSPLFGDVTGFPPTFLQSGTRDMFLSNTVRMHRKLRAAGIEAELHVGEAMPHGGFGGAPEDLELQLELRRFLDRHRRDLSG